MLARRRLSTAGERPAPLFLAASQPPIARDQEDAGEVSRQDWTSPANSACGRPSYCIQALLRFGKTRVHALAEALMPVSVAWCIIANSDPESTPAVGIACPRDRRRVERTAIQDGTISAIPSVLGNRKSPTSSIRRQLDAARQADGGRVIDRKASDPFFGQRWTVRSCGSRPSIRSRIARGS